MSPRLSLRAFAAPLTLWLLGLASILSFAPIGRASGEAGLGPCAGFAATSVALDGRCETGALRDAVPSTRLLAGYRLPSSTRLLRDGHPAQHLHAQSPVAVHASLARDASLRGVPNWASRALALLTRSGKAALPPPAA
jgi:hypothetical protein